MEHAPRLYRGELEELHPEVRRGTYTGRRIVKCAGCALGGAISWLTVLIGSAGLIASTYGCEFI